MFSSAVTNKQLRSFWMSRSQRIPVWTSFPPVCHQRSFLQGSCYIANAASWESRFCSTDVWTDNDWETGIAQGIYQDTRECAGCVSASSQNYRTLPPFFTVILNRSLGSISTYRFSFSLFLALGEKCPRTAISWTEGVDVCPPLKEQHYSTSISQSSFRSESHFFWHLCSSCFSFLLQKRRSSPC